MDTKVSIQIIAKETTPLGRLFFQCCLQALLDSDWPNEIIIVDNGCSADVLSMVDGFHQEFALQGTHLRVEPLLGNVTYSDLRNFGMSLISPDTTIYHWVDTDEVYFPEKLNQLRKTLEKYEGKLRQIYTYFYHFTFDPRTWQFKATKDNIFAYHKGLHWTKGVHEHVDGLLPGQKVQTDVEYLHFGYLRPQWQTTLKWLHYDMLEFKNVDRYKDERLEDQDKKVYTEPYFREWRTPNTILDDRREECAKQGPWPRERVPAAAAPVYAQADRWDEFLRETEDYTLWDRWQELCLAADGWRDTLDEIVRIMEACNWSYNGTKKENHDNPGDATAPAARGDG